MSAAVCLNADLGELSGPEGRALDAAILGVVTRCNVACGGHAGDEASMRETVRRAKASGVRVGAHPSYPDRENFGRVSLGLPPGLLEASLIDQVAALKRIAREEGVEIVHLKPHGALYNDAARDAELSEIIVRVAAGANVQEILGPPKSELEQAAGRAGLTFIAEGFADRSYEADGNLTPRGIPGAVISDPHAIEANALSMAQTGMVTARTGEMLSLGVATLCLHSDTPGAATHAAHIRKALEAAGVAVRV